MLALSIAVAVASPQTEQTVIVTVPEVLAATTSIPNVPFYSQFADITSAKWKKVGCGIASLAMVIDYYKSAVPVDTLLKEGIERGAYLTNAGWTYKGLITVAGGYGFKGQSFDLGKSSVKTAFAEFKKSLKDGPVIASVHYKFDPRSTIPHQIGRAHV